MEAAASCSAAAAKMTVAAPLRRRAGRVKFYRSELTVSCESNSRNKSFLGIALSILVLMLISTMIVAAIVIINPEIANFSSGAGGAREAVSLEEALLGELSANDFNFFWLPAASQRDGERYDELLYEDSKNLYLVTMPSGERQVRARTAAAAAAATPLLGARSFKPNVTTLVSNSSLLSSIDYQGFKLSPSKRYLLIWTARRKQFRHSFTAKYFVYDISNDLISLISTTKSSNSSGGDTSTNNKVNHYEHLDSASLYLGGAGDDELARFQLVEWLARENSTAAGQLVDSLVLVQNNDIYLLENVADLSSAAASLDSQAAASPKRLTFTGRPGEIFNGIPDWLYEEEILTGAAALQVAPKANRLAFLSFDDSAVSSMPYTVYGDQVLPRVQHIKYPKTGQRNPRVTAHVVDLARRGGGADGADASNSRAKFQAIELQLPAELAGQLHYINRLNWLTDDKLALIWTSRNQNAACVVICSASSNWFCEINLQLEAAGGWLDMSDDLFALDDEHYLALLPKFEGADVGSFKHIAKVALVGEKNSFTFVTGGKKEVVAINGVDTKRSLVYYTSTVVGEPGQRQLFVAELPGGGASFADTAKEGVAAAAAPPQPAPTAASSGAELAGASYCVTCDHYPAECLYNFAKLSPSTNYYVFQCDGPSVPRTELRATVRRRGRPAPAAAAATPGSARNARALFEGATSAAAKLDKSAPATNQAADLTAHTKGPNSISDEGAASHLRDADGAATASAQQNSAADSLLWVIEDNKQLRDELENRKAMPLTMRLKVPIANTNYSANVILLLPPQLGNGASSAQARSRPRRETSAPGAKLRKPLHSFYTTDSIGDYIDQLASGGGGGAAGAQHQQHQFPMVVDVYAGPNSQRVDYRFNVYFGHYLASSRRTVYAMIDGRGSGFQGTKRSFELYHKFGSVEIDDQIEVSAYLARTLPFIDQTKVAIWGWSYGGYAAAMALARSNAKPLQTFQNQLKLLKSSAAAALNGSSVAAAAAAAGELSTKIDVASKLRTLIVPQAAPQPPPLLRGVFECAASVAPVTNWILYDTAYTERYMSSPWQDDSYEPAAAVAAAGAGQASRRQLVAANKWSSLNQTSRGARSQQLLLDALKAAKRRATTTSARQTDPSLYLNERYRRASLLEHIENIDRKRFLLIHGTADDNVHFQQSIMLMRKLIEKNILFETRLYPDQDHSIANRADKLHLGHTLSNFFTECFDMAL